MLFGYYSVTTHESYTGVIKIEFSPVAREGQTVIAVDVANEAVRLNHEVAGDERVYGPVVVFEADPISSALSIIGTGDRTDVEALLGSIVVEISNEIAVDQVEIIENEVRYLEVSKESNIGMIENLDAVSTSSSDLLLNSQRLHLIDKVLELEVSINDLLRAREDIYVMQTIGELIIVSNPLSPLRIIIWPIIIAILTFIIILYCVIFDGRIRRRYDVEKVIDNVDVISVLPNKANNSELTVFTNSVNYFSDINDLQKIKFRNLGKCKNIDIKMRSTDKNILIPTSFDADPIFLPSKGTGLILLFEFSKITQEELLSEISNLRFAGQEKIGLVLFGVPRADIDWASVSVARGL
jgi:hypothetical protein